MIRFFKSLDLRIFKVLADRVFHNRKIVIVSEGKASTINISRNFQMAATVIILLAALWVPFSAGKLIAINNTHKRVVSKPGDSVEQRVEVLQNDIMLLEEYLKALHKYDNFELNKVKKNSVTARKDDDSTDDVSQLENKRDDIMIELKKRTLARIVTIDGFLKSAGLNYTKITGKQDLFARMQQGSSVAEGGPFIPATIDDIVNMEQDNYLSAEFIDEMNYLFELQKIVNNLPFSNPVAYNKVSSPFGVRHDPFNGRLSMHAGMDLQGNNGSYIVATGPGKVTYSGVKGAYGLMVEVNHGYGFTTRYGHLRGSLVKPGDYVSRGQVVGVQGCSGRCTGDHVHYEVRVNDVPSNPLPYLIKANEIQYYYAKKL